MSAPQLWVSDLCPRLQGRHFWPPGFAYQWCGSGEISCHNTAWSSSCGCIAGKGQRCHIGWKPTLFCKNVRSFTWLSRWLKILSLDLHCCCHARTCLKLSLPSSMHSLFDVHLVLQKNTGLLPGLLALHLHPWWALDWLIMWGKYKILNMGG